MDRLTFSFMRLLFFILALISMPTFASTVIVVGDSQTTGPFGKTLDQLLRQNHNVVTRGVCGSIGQHWQDGKTTTCAKWNWGKDIQGHEILSTVTPKLSDLVNDVNPDYVILQFGGNYRNKLEDPNFSISDDVSKLIETAQSKGAKCLFVTGPDTYKQRELIPATIERLEKGVAGKCDFFDSSQPVTQYPDEAAKEILPNGKHRVDGYHYNFVPEGEPVAKAWAKMVFEKFTELEQSISLSSGGTELHSQE